MSILSGEKGAIDGIKAVGKWSINENAALTPIRSSNTRGGTDRVPGTRDWNGSYEAYGHTPDKMPNDEFTFIGGLDGVKGYSGDCIQQQTDISWDFEGGAPIRHSAAFAAMGVLTPGAFAVVDDTISCHLPSVGNTVEIFDPVDPVGGSPSYVALQRVRTVELSILAELAGPAAHSDSGGYNERARGNIDVNVSIPVYVVDPELLPRPNTIKGLRIQVASSPDLYWQVLWLIFGEMSNLEVDIESNTIIGATLNASLKGFVNIGGTCTPGRIIRPGESEATAWWDGTPPTP